MPADLQALKAQHPLEVVAENLTRQPIEAHKIACPFHADSTPSLHLYQDGRWKCFGCGKHGDVLDFIGFWLKRDSYRPEDHLPEVIDFLGGINITPLRTDERRLQEAPAPAVEFPIEQLDRWTFALRPEHIAYWDNRGIWQHTIRRFRLGWDGDRLTIPASYRGVCYGVKRRAFAPGQQPKYTMAKGSRTGLFNADVLLSLHGQDAPLFVVEGEIEAMLLDQFGYPAVSSTGGCATWRPHWAQFLAHLDKIIVIYDNDQPGRDGALLVRQHLRRGRIRHWPAGCKDGGEWLPRPEAWDWLQDLIAGIEERE